MLNIYKLKIFIIELTDVMPDPSDFLMSEYDDYTLIGLNFESIDLLENLSDFKYESFDLLTHSFDNHHLPFIEKAKHFIGLDMTLNQILDVLNYVDKKRKVLLESTLYHKFTFCNTIENTFVISVKHYYDFKHYNSYYINDIEVIEHNEDFSKSNVSIKTYLTKKQLEEEFKDYLIKN